MSALKIGIFLVPVSTTPVVSSKLAADVSLQLQQELSIEAELLDITARLCRLRIQRAHCRFDPSDYGIRFAWTDLIARVIWTNTTDDYVELGLLMPGDEDCP